MADGTGTQALPADDKAPAPADEQVTRISAKLDEVLGEKKKLAERLRAFEAAEAERKAKEAEAEEAAARQKGEWEKVEATYKKKLTDAEAVAAEYKGKFEGLVVDLGLSAALDAAKITGPLRKAAAALIRAENTIELAADGSATVGGKPLVDFVAEWAKSDAGKAFIPAGASGGGAAGGGTGGSGATDNPWKAGPSYNLTRQGQIMRSDPAAAARLKAEAGAL